MAFEKVGVRASIEGMRRFERDAERFNRRIAGMGRTTGKLGGPLGLVRGALGKMGGALSNVAQIAGGIIVANVFGKIANAISSMANKAVGFTKDSIMLAARVEELDVIVKLLGKRAGLTEDEVDGLVNSIKDLGITTDVAQGLMIQFSRWGLKMADATKLARVAQDAAVISMQDSSEALAGLMHGITTMNTRVLRTYGITLASTVDAQDEYAASIGKTRDQLTGAEKIQAVLNAVLAQGETIAGAYEAAMGTAGKQMRSMKRHVKELMISIGTPFLKAFSGVIEHLTDFWKTMRKAAEEGGPLNRIITKIADVFGDKLVGALDVAEDVLSHVFDIMGRFFKLTDEGWSAFGAAAKVIHDFFPPEIAHTIGTIMDFFGRLREGFSIFGSLAVLNRELFSPQVADALGRIMDFFKRLMNMGVVAKRVLLGPFAAFLDIIRSIGRVVKGLVLGEFTLEDILPLWLVLRWEWFLRIIDQFRDWWDRNGPTILAHAERIFGTIAKTIGDLAERIIPWVLLQFKKISDWFDIHEDDITGAIKTIADFFEFTLGPAVTRLWDNVLGPFLGDVVDLLLEVGGLLIKTFGGEREKFFDVGLGVVSLGPRKPTDMEKFFADLDAILTDFLFVKFPEHFRNFRDFVLDFFGLPNWDIVAEAWRSIWDNLIVIWDVWKANLLEKIKAFPEELVKTILSGGAFGELMRMPVPGFDPVTGTYGNFEPIPATQAHNIPSSFVVPPSTGNTQTSNFNLVVNTSAPSEPIIADFRMLAALGGRP